LYFLKSTAMKLNTELSVKKVQIKEMKEYLELYEDADQLDNLSAFAVFDSLSQKYIVKIEDKKNSVVFVLRLRRPEQGLRYVNLDTAAKNIYELGFVEFTVLMERSREDA